MSDSKLILHPKNPFAGLTDIASCVESLQKIGFIDETCDWFGEIHYKPGSEFLVHLRFLQEHHVNVLEFQNNQLELTKQLPNRDTCHIFISPVSIEPKIITSPLLELPRCPNCRHEDDLQLLDEWHKSPVNYVWKCPSCGITAGIHELDWNRTAAFARYSIDIWNIHFDEAFPTQQLLDHLHSITGISWDYIYYHS